MYKNFSSRLKHLITFQTERGDDQVWEDEFEVYAETIPLYDNKYSSIENLNFGQVITEDYYLFNLYFHKSISNKMRIKLKNKIFDIKRIINVGELDKYLKIIALKVEENV